MLSRVQAIKVCVYILIVLTQRAEKKWQFQIQTPEKKIIDAPAKFSETNTKKNQFSLFPIDATKRI